MNVLVLGGTQFVGRHIVAALLDAGHAVATFTRGKTNPDLFPRARKLTGDRNGDVSAIEEAVGRRPGFDACVDVSGYEVAQVERTLDVLADRVDRYVYISTVSVYKVPVESGFTEDAPIEETEDRYASLTPQTYGRLKAECERTVQSRMGTDRATVFRLGLVNGPWDHTDRATYWSIRAGHGGEIFVPAAPDTPFQVIDARDIGRGAVRALENAVSGVYTMVNDPTTWNWWLEESARIAGASPTYVFVDDQEWIEKEARSITDARVNGALPMYLPAAYGRQFWEASNGRARAAGFEFRPYTETIADTVEWRRAQDYDLRAGLTREQERALIEKWRGR